MNFNQNGGALSNRSKKLFLSITASANSLMQNFGIDPFMCAASTRLYFLAIAADGAGKPSLAQNYRTRLFNRYMDEKNYGLAESFALQNDMGEEAKTAAVQRAVSLNMHGTKI